tara:strand:+ start:134 stop:340 length:207 start_codon:yes stop_codon:yes gene_type:complete
MSVDEPAAVVPESLTEPTATSLSPAAAAAVAAVAASTSGSMRKAARKPTTKKKRRARAPTEDMSLDEI